VDVCQLLPVYAKSARHFVEGLDGRLYYVERQARNYDIYLVELPEWRFTLFDSILARSDYAYCEGRNGYFLLFEVPRVTPSFVVEVPGFAHIRYDKSAIDYSARKRCFFCRHDAYESVVIDGVRKRLRYRVVSFNSDRCIYTAIDGSKNDVLVIDATTDEVVGRFCGVNADRYRLLYPVSATSLVAVSDGLVDIITGDRLYRRVPTTNSRATVYSVGDACIVHCQSWIGTIYIDFSSDYPVVVDTPFAACVLVSKGLLITLGDYSIAFIGKDKLASINGKTLLGIIGMTARLPTYKYAVSKEIR